MKKQILATILFLALSFSANSQITKGNWMLGGDANFYYSNTSISTSSNYSIFINPNIGYFIKDRLAIGSQLGISFNDSSTSLSLNPFIRYYLLKQDKKINYFTEAGFGYGAIFSKNTNSTYKTIGYNIKAGSVFFLNDVIGLEFSLKYLYGKQLSFNTTSQNLIIGFGFQIHLEKNN